jgi:hypothetical protein
MIGMQIFVESLSEEKSDLRPFTGCGFAWLLALREFRGSFDGMILDLTIEGAEAIPCSNFH